jgi:hypothetical protein
LHRKALIRLINGELARKPRRQQRGKTYGVEVQAAVRLIAESLDYPCAERLQPNLVGMAKHLSQHGELCLTPEELQKLGQISVSTVWRLLPRREPERPRLARSKKRPGAPHRYAGDLHFSADLPATGSRSQLVE